MKYAIVETGGKQFKAVEGGTLEVDRLPVEAGKNIKLEQVLLLADGDNVTVGTPLVKDNPVWAKVLQHFKGPKVIIFNYSPKKRIRVKTGHRQNYTRLLVQQIGGAELVKKAPVVVEKAAETKGEKAGRIRKAATSSPKGKPAKAEAKAAPKAEAKTAAASPKGKKPAAAPKAKAASKAEPKVEKSSPKGKPATKAASPKAKPAGSAASAAKAKKPASTSSPKGKPATSSKPSSSKGTTSSKGKKPAAK